METYDMSQYVPPHIKPKATTKANRMNEINKLAKSTGWQVGKTNGKITYTKRKEFPSRTKQTRIVVTKPNDYTIERAEYRANKKITSTTTHETKGLTKLIRTELAKAFKIRRTSRCVSDNWKV